MNVHSRSTWRRYFAHARNIVSLRGDISLAKQGVRGVGRVYADDRGGTVSARRACMTLRIVQEPLDSGMMLRVAGALSGPEVSELETCCRNAQPPLTLELEGVITVDDRGLVLLRSMAADGVRLVGASPYLSMRLGRTSRDET